ncbi:hypothetical protein L3X38_018144 [Prunus dulcis]|uniref:Uncharacterized protein n=1 Tax=Prunus dulcis TaxID=3755 RepID=A0AAD4Z9U0_PRUDU|nr:hypothetical protein L3X38_018144 [Prunus dulcis]
MHNLELLLLDNVKISGGYEDFPKNLIWLSWRGFALKSIPTNLHFENLIALDLRNISLQHVWKGTKFLPRLKILNLSNSHGLVTTPDLSGFPNLERLILKDCINLKEVDESIGDLEKLVFLNLKDCKNLMKLPIRISMLQSLQKLILSGCLNLVLPASIVGVNFPQKNIRQKIPSSPPPLFLPAKQIGVKDHTQGVLAKGPPMPKLGRVIQGKPGGRSRVWWPEPCVRQRKRGGC